MISLCICDPISQWLCVLFQPFIQSLSVDLYLALLNLYLRDPSLERKASFFLKVFFCYLGIYLLQPGYILSVNKLASLLGNQGSNLGMNDIVLNLIVDGE